MSVGSVVVVDDDGAMRELLIEELSERGYTVHGAPDLMEGLALIEDHCPDVVVTDLNLSRGSGLDVCKGALALDPDVPVILITAFGSLESAVAAIRAGAYDFITKPFGLETLALAVDRAVRLRALKHEVARLRVTVERQRRSSGLDGVGSAMSRLRDRLATIATTDTTVMLLGESGSGKEVAAREVHALSRRSGGPFVAENIAAIPSELLESTLFGHVRGAFTGATTNRDGLFRTAHGGTLLLDEIGEMPLQLQPKLLRVLEEGRVRPVGSDKEIPVDVRLLSATHQDLESRVVQGLFRADLFYRLAVVEIEVPPLRDRGMDILLLAQRFLAQHAQTLERPVTSLHHEAAARLLNYAWPGNVRELRNAMQHAVLLCKGTTILPTDLPPRIQGVEVPALPRLRPQHTPLRTLAEVEREHVERVLESLEGNKAKAARVLGIGRKTLYRKLDMWDLGHHDPADDD